MMYKLIYLYIITHTHTHTHKRYFFFLSLQISNEAIKNIKIRGAAAFGLRPLSDTSIRTPMANVVYYIQRMLDYFQLYEENAREHKRAADIHILVLLDAACKLHQVSMSTFQTFRSHYVKAHNYKRRTIISSRKAFPLTVKYCHEADGRGDSIVREGLCLAWNKIKEAFVKYKPTRKCETIGFPMDAKDKSIVELMQMFLEHFQQDFRGNNATTLVKKLIGLSPVVSF